MKKTAIWFILSSVLLSLFTSCLSINSYDLFVASDDSMLPNINTGDYLIINRTSISHLNYGDVVLFSTPGIDDETLNYVWRVIALPGDNLSIKEDMYSIEGKQVYYQKTGENVLLREGYSYDEYEETMPNGRKVLIFSSLLHPQKKHFDNALTILPDRFYLLGDLRSASFDSRFVGAVPKSFITGKVIKVIKDKNFFKVRWTFYKYALWDYKKESIECF